ncbi:unnamed protein product [Rotaria sordida]|uniref:Uncharacterized protein n=2 Tax=Rotaria sordida TaxID=392033 RepID=A0A815L383_9BILA|nr:unnamed protein product [Rotaria sordida]
MISLVSTFNCRLYGIDQSSIETKLIKINNSSTYDPILNLGRSTFSGKATSTKIDNQNYQIAAINDNDIIGIRESFHPGSTLEVAKINQTNGLMKTIGTYPYGSYSLVMTYASKRRLYYNIIESTLYAVNVDTGNLYVNIQIPNDYLIYALDYDSINDRLTALVYSSSITNGWILTQMIITTEKEIQFDRIGKTVIPFEKYLWTTTYIINSNEHSWMAIWSVKNSNASIFILFNIDTGEIIEKWEISSKNLGNLVCFD